MLVRDDEQKCCDEARSWKLHDYTSNDRSSFLSLYSLHRYLYHQGMLWRQVDTDIIMDIIMVDEMMIPSSSRSSSSSAVSGRGQRRAMGALALIFFWLCAGGKEATPSLYVLTYSQNLFVI